jgi:hypothetical protein
MQEDLNPSFATESQLEDQCAYLNLMGKTKGKRCVKKGRWQLASEPGNRYCRRHCMALYARVHPNSATRTNVVLLNDQKPDQGDKHHLSEEGQSKAPSSQSTLHCAEKNISEQTLPIIEIPEIHQEEQIPPKEESVATLSGWTKDSLYKLLNNEWKKKKRRRKDKQNAKCVDFGAYNAWGNEVPERDRDIWLQMMKSNDQ